jgi:hypothetical protein
MPILNVGFKAHREMGIDSLSKEEMVGVFQIEAVATALSVTLGGRGPNRKQEKFVRKP